MSTDLESALGNLTIGTNRAKRQADIDDGLDIGALTINDNKKRGDPDNKAIDLATEMKSLNIDR